MDPIDRRLMLGAAGLVGVAAFTKLASAGPLDPPAGPISPTGHTTDELYARIARTAVGVAEPRVPIQSLSGSATAKYVISQPGSYYLVDNIAGEPGKNGIEVLADGVSIDLCGFAMNGGPKSDAAIKGPSPRTRIMVHNGTISGWGGVGVELAEECVVDSLVIQGCGDRAISIDYGTVTRCRVRSCGGFDGSIFAYENSIIRDCVVVSSGDVAIFCVRLCQIIGCQVRFNSTGCIIQDVGLVSGCHADQCGVAFSVYSGVIEDCSTVNCGRGAAGHKTLVRNCKFRGNGAAIYLSDGCRADGNELTECTIGIQIADGATATLSIRNAATGCATPYAFTAGSHGPVVVATNAGDISALPNANHPWANFVY